MINDIDKNITNVNCEIIEDLTKIRHMLEDTIHKFLTNLDKNDINNDIRNAIDNMQKAGLQVSTCIANFYILDEEQKKRLRKEEKRLQNEEKRLQNIYENLSDKITDSLRRSGNKLYWSELLRRCNVDKEYLKNTMETLEETGIVKWDRKRNLIELMNKEK